MIPPDTGQTEYILRVAGQQTLGSSGTIGSDQKTFSSEQELVGCLRALGVSEGTILRAEGSARAPASILRFIGFAVDEQLPFSHIEDADFHLFDT